jgi:hypothetical protein
VRERLQRVANRLVYGKRATPYEVLSQFSERVAESYASDDVLPRMARVLGDGTAAELAEVWLRNGSELHRAAAFPADGVTPPVVELNGATPTIPGADRSVAVRHQGEVLGALTITKRRGESITPIEVKLMDDLAHQAGRCSRTWASPQTCRHGLSTSERPGNGWSPPRTTSAASSSGTSTTAPSSTSSPSR